jgi:hypothetical protein
MKTSTYLPMRKQREKMRKLSIRINSVQRQKLKDLSAEVNKQRSTIIRELINNGTVKQRLNKEQVKLSLQLTGMANNLNQLTKRLHQCNMQELANYTADVKSLLNNLLKCFDI